MNFIAESKIIFDIGRPKVFMDNPNHCGECKDVEFNAQENDINTLTLAKAGDGYASLLSFLNDIGFIYYMPAFIRLCIETTMDEGYISEFIFAITDEKQNNSRLHACTKEQRQFIYNFLKWYKNNHSDILKQWLIEENEIDEAISLWSA